MCSDRDYYCVIIISNSGPLVPRLETYLLKILGFNQANSFLLKTRSCSSNNNGGRGDTLPTRLDKQYFAVMPVMTYLLTDLCRASRKLH